MRIRRNAARRVALGVGLAGVAAGLLVGPWGVALRADARTLVAGTHHSGSAGPPMSPAPLNTSDGASRSVGSSADTAQAAVNAAVPRLVAGRPADSVSILATDATTGVSVGWGTRTLMPAASVFKLTLLESFLLRNQERGQPISQGASNVLAAMIDNSDNDSADRVYEVLGGDVGVASRMHALGLSATTLGPRDQWGLSTTSSADQMVLLRNLVSPGSPLLPTSRAYALALMSKVEPDQRWGVSAAADPGTNFANKNGWLNVDDDGGRWVVSSVGVIEAGGHQVLLAVLTHHDADLNDGIHLVESLSRAVATALGSQPQASGPAADPTP